MKLFHFSDNHGKIDWLRKIDLSKIDCVVSTGDFFPNCSRGNRVKEVGFQTRWFDSIVEEFKEILGDLPFLVVDGNHDYIPLGQAMLLAGYSNVIPITPEGVTVGGIKFAGFGEVPYFTGEWNRETDWEDLRDLVEDTMFSKPDVLVTHAPCLGILDDGIGIEPLSTALSYEHHNVRHHLFGHNHLNGGHSREVMDIMFHNAATTYGIVVV